MRLVKNIGVYTLIQFIQKGISFFSLPLFTALVLPYGLGIYNEVIAFTSFFILLFGIGLDEAAAKLYFDVDSKDEKREILSTIGILSLIASGLGIFFLLFIDWLMPNVFLSKLPESLVYGSFVIILLTPIVNIYTKILRMDNRVYLYSVLTVFQSAGHILLTLILLKFTSLDYVSLICSTILIGIVLFFVSVGGMTGFKLSFDRLCSRIALTYALPLLPHKLFGWGLMSFCVLAIGHYSGSDSVGLFIAMAYISVIIDFFGKSLFNALQPWVYGLLKNNSDTKIIVQVFRFISLTAILVAGVLFLWGKELLELIIAKSYKLEYLIINTLTLSSVLMFIGSMTVFILYYDRTSVKYTSFSTAIGVFFNVALSILIIPRFGLLGASISLALSNLIIAYLKIYYAKRTVKDLKLIDLLSLSLVLFFGITLFLQSQPSTFFKVVISMLYIIAFVPVLMKKLKEIRVI